MGSPGFIGVRRSADPAECSPYAGSDPARHSRSNHHHPAGEAGEKDGEHQGLPVMELCMGRPAGVEQVSATVVCNVRSNYQVEAHEAEKDTTNEWHTHGSNSISFMVPIGTINEMGTVSQGMQKLE